MVPKYSAEWWARVSTSLSGQETKNIRAEHASDPITSTSLEQGSEAEERPTAPFAPAEVCLSLCAVSSK
jgi:hypothetical protein